MPSGPQITFQGRTFALDIAEIPSIAHSVQLLEQIAGAWVVAGTAQNAANPVGVIYSPADYSDHSQMAQDELDKGGIAGLTAWLTSRINAAFIALLPQSTGTVPTGTPATDESVFQEIAKWGQTIQFVVQGSTVVVAPK